jgi:hypothetical protein
VEGSPIRRSRTPALDIFSYDFLAQVPPVEELPPNDDVAPKELPDSAKEPPLAEEPPNELPPNDPLPEKPSPVLPEKPSPALPVERSPLLPPPLDDAPFPELPVLITGPVSLAPPVPASGMGGGGSTPWPQPLKAQTVNEQASRQDVRKEVTTAS